MSILKTLPKRLSSIFSNAKFRYVFLCLFSTVLLVFSYTLYDYFTIRQVEIVSKETQKITGLYSLQQKNLLMLDTKEEEKNIQQQNPAIKSISIEKKYPYTVEVRVELMETIAYLQNIDGYFELGENGRILGKMRGVAKRTPVIDYYQQFPYRDHQAGSFIENKDIITSLYFLKELEGLGVRIQTIDIDGFHMLGLYTDEKKFIFSAEKDRATQSYQVSEIIKQLKRQSKEFKTVDVRFEKPIITF